MERLKRLINPEAARREDERAKKRAQYEERKAAFQERLSRLSPEMQEEIETVMRRGRRSMRNLKNLKANNANIVAEHLNLFYVPPRGNERLSEYSDQGVKQLLQILLGVIPTVGALALPRTPLEYGLAGFASLFGAGLVWYRALEWKQHLSPVQKRKARKEIARKGGDASVFEESDEFTSEQNLRTAMLESDDLIREMRADLRAKRRDFQELVIKEIDPLKIKIRLDDLVADYDDILDRAIEHQDRLSITAPQYAELSSLHKEKRLTQTLGLATAASLVVAGRGALGSIPVADEVIDNMRGYVSAASESPALRAGAAAVGTLIAILAGALVRLKHDAPNEKSAKQLMKGSLTLAGQELKMLKKRKLENVAYLAKLRPKDVHDSEPSASEALPPEPVDTTIMTQLLDRAYSAVHDISADFDFPPFVEHLPPEAPPEAPVLAAGPVPLECPERAITPPPFDKIESSSLRREVDPQIIVDLMNIAGRKLTVPTSSIGWVDAPNVVSNAFVEDAGHDISEAAFDEAIRYLGELDDRLTAHQSVRNFQQSHLARLVALRSDMQTRLYASERATYRDLIMYGSPSAFRAAILRRSRIADFPDDRIDDISQEQFEESIRQWMQHKSTRDHDRTSLRRFLDTCQETLNAIPSHVPTRDEKARIVKRVGDVLDEFLPEVAMPDPEQVSAWGRRIDEISALFNRIQSAPNYDRRQRVPELLAGEPFVPSDVLREVRFADGHLGDLRIMSVDTKGILGSYVDRAAWIVQDRDRIVELAAPLIQTPTPEVLQNFFMSRVRRGDREHLEENIQLLRIPGPNPRKSIYFVYRGIQHVAAARVAGLQRIIARVYELRAQDSAGNIIVTTKYRDRYEEWLELKEAGLIDGKLVSQQDLVNQYAWLTPENSDRKETPTPVVAKIRFQTVPWLIWCKLNPHDEAPMRSISEITDLYRKLYAPPQGSTETGPLDKLKTADGRKLEPKYLTEFKYLHSLITRKGMRTA